MTKLTLDLGPGFDLKDIPGTNTYSLTKGGADTGRTVLKNKVTINGNTVEFTDTSALTDLFPGTLVKRYQDIVASGINPKAVQFNREKMMVDTDGKVYIRDSDGKRQEIPGFKSYDPETGDIIIDSAKEGEFNAAVSKGLANPGQVVGPEDAESALGAKLNETFEQWAGRMEKFGSYALKLGIVIVGVTTIASFVNWLREEAANVNNETFKITEIKREGKITYTSQYKICSGDSIYNFRGFENVNRPSMNNHPEYVTTGGVGTLSDSSQTFDAIEAGVSVKPPSGQELTFKVRTNEMRRLACTLAEVARDAANAAGNLGKNVTKGFFEGLGIDPMWLIGGIIILIVGAIIASVAFK